MARNTGDQIGDKVIWENDRFRVWAQTIEAGETVGPHSHENDYFIIDIDRTPVKADVIGPNKSKVERITEQLIWVESNGEEHTATNIDTEGRRWRNLIIEVKK